MQGITQFHFLCQQRRRFEFMISVEQAQEKVLANVSPLEGEDKPILDCLGQVLAEDVFSPFDIPPLANAAMDGYAVQALDTYGASPEKPRRLSVIGSLGAGRVYDGVVGSGQAVRIMTGAPLPRGADSVVRFEDTSEGKGTPASNEVSVFQANSRERNVRLAGEDVQKGALIFARGRFLTPAEIGVLASLGRLEVKVVRRPVVAILATGDELAELGEPLTPGQIYNSNSYSVAALVRWSGAVPQLLGIARDTRASLIARLRDGLEADLLITTGGVSAGDFDIVKDILVQEGDITFWTVRMKPGKPLAFGRIRGKDRKGNPRAIPHLGLPGNPVSSMVTFEMFVRPAIWKMLGRGELRRHIITATLQDDVENDDGRRVLARAVITEKGGQHYARLTGPQGSGILTSMSEANGLVIITEDSPGARKGDVVPVLRLDWKEE
jgi:molybdopterin molybdotransferase